MGAAPFCFLIEGGSRHRGHHHALKGTHRCTDRFTDAKRILLGCAGDVNRAQGRIPREIGINTMSQFVEDLEMARALSEDDCDRKALQAVVSNYTFKLFTGRILEEKLNKIFP